MRHNQQDENIVNETLLKFSKKHDIKIIAPITPFISKKRCQCTRYFIVCKRWRKTSHPNRKGRGYRYGLPNDEYYFKSTKK